MVVVAVVEIMIVVLVGNGGGETYLAIRDSTRSRAPTTTITVPDTRACACQHRRRCRRPTFFRAKFPEHVPAAATAVAAAKLERGGGSRSLIGTPDINLAWQRTVKRPTSPRRFSNRSRTKQSARIGAGAGRGNHGYTSRRIVAAPPHIQANSGTTATTTNTPNINNANINTNNSHTAISSADIALGSSQASPVTAAAFAATSPSW